MNANMQEYKLIMNTNIVIDRIVPFKRFCKDLYALWKVGHHLRITEISFYKPNSQDNKGLSSRADSVRCFVTDSEFMDTRNAKNVYNLLYPYNSEDFNKTFSDESLWRKTFSKH